MKALATFTALVLFTAALPAAGLAQSTLNFGYLIAPQELSRVGIAVVNPQTSIAETTFTLYGSAGQVLETSTIPIPAGGQLSRLASQLFHSAATSGWIQAASPVTGLRGFWLAGNFSTFGDAAEAEAGSSEMVLPIMTDQTDLTLLNPGSDDAAVLIRLYGANGREIAEPALRVLPPKGSFRGRSTTLFSPLDWPAGTHARIISGKPVAASATLTNFQEGPSLSVVNAQTTAAPRPTELALPHVVVGAVGENNNETIIGVANLSSASQTITLTFFPSDGSAPASIERTLLGNGGLRIPTRALFSLPGGFRSGWVRVLAPLGAAAFAANADILQAGVSISSGISLPQTDFIFGHIADLNPWWTGLALVNPGESSATVEIFAIAPDGTLIGGADNVASARFLIPPGGRISRLLSEWIPQTQSRSIDGGFVFLRSSVPLYGLSLFFTRDLRILSTVPGFDLAAGVNFVPPTSPR